MVSVPSIRRLARHEWRAYRELRLRALADSPDAFVTTLAEARAREDGDWSQQVSAAADSPSQIALVAELDSGLVGLAWSRIDDSDRERAHLYQMWVAPEVRGLGVGRMLLDGAVHWAAGEGVRLLVLSVTYGASAAERLYERAGFEPSGAREPLRAGSDLQVQPMQLALGGEEAGS